MTELEMGHVSGCIFCDIVDGRWPASVVHSDDTCMAFMDVQPVNPGHMLVIPKNHLPLLKDMREETGAHLFRVAQRLAEALRKCGLKCEGVNLFLADGEAAMQEVFHVHLHVFPRYKGDGFGLKFSEAYFTKPSRTEIESAARFIKAVL